MASPAGADGNSPSLRSLAQTCSSMKFDRGSASYRAAGTAPGKGIFTSQLANRPTNRAEMVASPGIGPAVTRPSASTLTRADSLEANAASAVTSSADPSVKWAVTRSENDSPSVSACARSARRRSARRGGRPPACGASRRRPIGAPSRSAEVPGSSRRPPPCGSRAVALRQQQALGRASGETPVVRPRPSRSPRNRGPGRNPAATGRTRSGPAPCRDTPRHCNRPASGSARRRARRSPKSVQPPRGRADRARPSPSSSPEGRGSRFSSRSPDDH